MVFCQTPSSLEWETYTNNTDYLSGRLSQPIGGFGVMMASLMYVRMSQLFCIEKPYRNNRSNFGLLPKQWTLLST